MKADEVLDGIGVAFEVVEQERQTKGCEEAAEERGVETSQIVKSLIVESEGERFHFCIPGDRKLSEKKFREHRLVDPETSEQITGFESGTVHPLSSDLEHVVDERVFENGEVSFTTGKSDEGVIIDSSKFRKALESSDFEYDVRDVVVTEEEDIEELEERGLESQEAQFILESGYRKLFLDFSEEFDPSQVLKAVRKLHREEIDFSSEEVRKLLERSENETHMQKLAKTLSKEGEISEEDGFELEEAVKEALQSSPEAVEDYRDGKESAINYLLGQVMNETNGRADAGKTRELLLEELEA